MKNTQINYNKISLLPHLIKSFCYPFESWIVGGGAKYLLDIQKDLPRDWDILIPFWQWGNACRIIPEGSKTNSFGGIKIENIDIWGGDIGWFMGQTSNYPSYAINLKYMISLESNKEIKRVKL